MVGITLLLTACGSTTSPSGTAAPTGDPEALTPPALDERLAPLVRLGACTDEPESQAVFTDAPGLVLPPQVHLTTVEENDGATRIEGYVPMTPVELRVWFEESSGRQILEIEDEVVESEVLVTDGQHRLFVKAQAVCERGSILVAIVAPESAADQVPEPAGEGS